MKRSVSTPNPETGYLIFWNLINRALSTRIIAFEAPTPRQQGRGVGARLLEARRQDPDQKS